LFGFLRAMLAAAEHFTSVYKTISPHGDTVISSSGFVWSGTVPKAWNLRSLERVRGKASAHVYNCIIHLLIDLMAINLLPGCSAVDRAIALQICAATAHLVYKLVQPRLTLSTKLCRALARSCSGRISRCCCRCSAIRSSIWRSSSASGRMPSVKLAFSETSPGACITTWAALYWHCSMSDDVQHASVRGKKIWKRGECDGVDGQMCMTFAWTAWSIYRQMDREEYNQGNKLI